MLAYSRAAFAADHVITDHRVTAEQRTKEGKKAVTWTRCPVAASLPTLGGCKFMP